MCGVDLSSHVLAVAVVVACLSLSVGGGDAYVLPDDVVQPTLTDHHHHHSQGKTSAGGLEVAVEPEFVVMRHSRPVHISCAASTTTKQRLYLSFFWQILEDTSLPLSSSVPGVRVEPMILGAPRSRYLVTEGGGDGQVNGARLTLSWRFYDFLPRGDNMFGCLAYTLDGRRSVRYFTVQKN